MPIILQDFASSLWVGDPGLALPGSGTSQPPGLESFIEYNGIVIHDRLVVDKYRVISLDGLHGGPEIRSNEESNPGDVGMTPLGNLLGGRTFMIEGTVMAHNIGKLRDMEQALRMAFYSMIERPLVLHTGDASRDVYVMCRTADKIGLKEEQADTNAFRKFLITMRCSDPRIYALNSRIYSMILGVSDDFSSGSVAPWTIDSGSAYTISSGVLVLPTASTRSTRKDLGYKLIDGRETMKLTLPASGITGDVVGARIKKIDDINYVWARVRVTSSTAAVIEVVKTVGGTDTTLTTTASLTVAVGGTYWFQTSIVDNLVTAKLFSTDPTLGPGTQVGTTASYTLAAGAERTAFGAGVMGDVGIRSATTNSWKIDDYEVEPVNMNHQILTPHHSGSYFALPVVTIAGPATDVQVVNELEMPDESFSRSIKIDGIIPAGRSYIYDASAGTLVDDLGVRKDSQLNVSSRQLQLANGDNPVTMIASSTGITSAISIKLSDTWI